MLHSHSLIIPGADPGSFLGHPTPGLYLFIHVFVYLYGSTIFEFGVLGRLVIIVSYFHVVL